MTRFSPITLRLLLLLKRQQRPSPRLQPPALCFPKQASQACVPRASAPAASPQAAWLPSASLGAPVCPPSPRPTPLTAHRVTSAGQRTVSPLNTNLFTPVLSLEKCTVHSVFPACAVFSCPGIYFVNLNSTLTSTNFITTSWVHYYHHQAVFNVFFYVFPSLI